MQDALQASGFAGKQGPESVGVQGHALDLLGAEGPLGDDGLGLTFQSDDGLIDGVDPRTAGGVHHRQALLHANTRRSFIIIFEIHREILHYLNTEKVLAFVVFHIFL